jgi:Predicted membrane protein
MNKSEFLLSLTDKLDPLPQHEIEKTRGFYAEMIDDRIEDGMSETEAVTAIGDIDTIVQDTLLEQPLPALMKAKIQPKIQFKDLGNCPDCPGLPGLVSPAGCFLCCHSFCLSLGLGGYYIPLCNSCCLCAQWPGRDF